MDKKDKEEFVGLISEALNDVMVPALEAMETRINERLSGVEGTLGSLERKFDAQQTRLDRHDKRISLLEEKTHIATS